MPTITRSMLRHLRPVFAKVFPSKTGPHLAEIRTEGGELVVRSAEADTVVAFRRPDDSPPGGVVVPWEFLRACEGRDHSPVRLEHRGGEVVATWADGEIPHTARCEAGEPRHVPAEPDHWEEHGPELRQALADASATADDSPTRYALQCLRLRGSDGTVAASDSRQMLVCSGFRFPWREDLLVVGHRVLQGITGADPVAIGRTPTHVVLGIGPWTVHLRIEPGRRFPDVDRIVADAESSTGTLRIAERDALFLLHSLKRLPVVADGDEAVTLDLDGQLVVRSRADGQTPPTELVLGNSERSGEELRCCTNRSYLERALKLGFRELRFRGTTAPLACRGDDRVYVWSTLAGDIVPGSDEAVRIVSPASTSNTRVKSRPVPTQPVAGKVRRRKAVPMPAEPTVLERAETLRSTLRDALSGTRELIRSLKQRKRQSKLVKATLASLRQLDAVEV